jgi:hypothetical protein
MNRDKIFPIRVNKEDEEIVAAIQAKRSIGSASEVWRRALLFYAKALKIKMKP